MGGAERAMSGREYLGVGEIMGPLVIVRGAGAVGYNELAEVRGADGRVRLGLILESSDTLVAMQVFEGTMGLTIPETRVRFFGRPLEIPVSREMLGRVFDGIGRPRDDGPVPISELSLDVNGLPINPTAREYPRQFIQTGISAIDGMNTLIRGQKLPIFSGSGLPHARIAAQIARQAKILDGGALPGESDGGRASSPPWGSSSTPPASSSTASRIAGCSRTWRFF
jgi:V/A-type H+-transporting ATPase subunit B